MRVEYFPRTYVIGNAPDHPKKDMQDPNIELEHFDGRIIFMSMFNDIDWIKKGNSENCFRILNKSRITRRDSREGPQNEEKWYGTHTYLHENLNPSLQKWWDILKILDSEYADSSNIELMFRTIHLANRLSMYGAISSWCEELAQWILGQNELTMEKSVAKENGQLHKNVKPQEVNSLVQTPRSNDGASGNRLREQLQRFGTLEKEIQFTRVREGAAFVEKKVYIGMNYKTIPGVD